MVWLLSQLANVEPKGLHGRNPDYPGIAVSPQTTATNRSEVFLRRLLAALEPPLGFIAAITVFFGLWFVVMQQSQDNLDSDHASP